MGSGSIATRLIVDTSEDAARVNLVRALKTSDWAVGALKTRLNPRQLDLVGALFGESFQEKGCGRDLAVNTEYRWPQRRYCGKCSQGTCWNTTEAGNATPVRA